MRTQEEIVQKIKDDNSMFGFAKDVYIGFLRYEHAKEFLIEEAKNSPDAEKNWNGDTDVLSKENCLKLMKEYMAFAWGKAEDHRGISAGRSIDKIRAYLWLLKDYKTLKKMDEAGYPQYGCPKLTVVCEKYSFPIPTDTTVQNMIKGQPCEENCRIGCGE